MSKKRTDRVQTVVSEDVAKKVEAIAEDEFRSKRQMYSILIKEAVEHRLGK